MAHDRALEARVVVHAVDSVCQPGSPHHILYLRARAVDERPDHTVAASRLDAGQPRRPGAADQTQQEGLRLVVPCVSGSDLSAALSLGQPPQSGIAQVAETRFQVSLRRQPGGEVGALPSDAETLGRGGGAALVGFRLDAAQPVIHVRGDQFDAEFATEVAEQQQQTDRVGSARHRDEDPIAGLEHRVAPDAALQHSEKPSARVIHGAESGSPARG